MYIDQSEVEGEAIFDEFWRKGFDGFESQSLERHVLSGSDSGSGGEGDGGSGRCRYKSMYVWGGKYVADKRKGYHDYFSFS